MFSWSPPSIELPMTMTHNPLSITIIVSVVVVVVVLIIAITTAAVVITVVVLNGHRAKHSSKVYVTVFANQKYIQIQWNLRREDSTGTSHLSSLGRLSSFGGSCFYN